MNKAQDGIQRNKHFAPALRTCSCSWSPAMRHYFACWNTSLWLCFLVGLNVPETVYATLRNVTCEQTYGHLGNLASLRCRYDPETVLEATRWSKADQDVYRYVHGDPSISGPCGEFVNRNVSTHTGLGHHYMNINPSKITDEDNYKCYIMPRDENTAEAECFNVQLKVQAVSQASYEENGKFIPVVDSSCVTGGQLINISSTDKSATKTIRYVVYSKPVSTAACTGCTSFTHTDSSPDGDGAITRTYIGKVVVNAGQKAVEVKLEVSSPNPDFTAGPRISEACVKINNPQEKTAVDINITQTYGQLNGTAILQCEYGTIPSTIFFVKWYKGTSSDLVYVYIKDTLDEARGEFASRDVNGTLDSSGKYHKMTIPQTKRSDEGIYFCEMQPSGQGPSKVNASVELKVQAVSHVSYEENGKFVPVLDSSCVTGGQLINISSTDKSATKTIHYVVYSKPVSTVACTGCTSFTHTDSGPDGDGAITRTYTGKVVVNAGQEAVKVKLEVSSPNPDFTAGPRKSEACVKINNPQGPPCTWKTLLYRFLRMFYKGTYTETHMSSCASLPVTLWHILLPQLGYVYFMTDM